MGLADDILAPSASEIWNAFCFEEGKTEFQQKSYCVEYELGKRNFELILTALEK